MTTVVSPEDFGNLDYAIAPSKTTVTDAPGSQEWNSLQGLLEFAKTLEKRNRVDMLLKGAVFSELKRLYREYTKALYKAGYRKEDIADYSQFKADSGFSIPSNASISNYTRVYACYVVSYAMATLKRKEHELYFSWVDPLLLAAPFDMLVYLFKENYHNSADRAREILYNLQPHIMKRSDFWLWLERQPRVNPPVVSKSLIDKSTPPNKPYQNSIQETVEPYQINAPDFWNKFMKDIEIPKTIKRPLRVTVTIDEIEYGESGNNARDI